MYDFITIVKFGLLIFGNSNCYISDILFFSKYFLKNKRFYTCNSKYFRIVLQTLNQQQNKILRSEE